MLIDPQEVPDTFLTVPELDVSSDLFAEPLQSSWLRIGAWATTHQRDARNVEEVIQRESLLLAPDEFLECYQDLGIIGNTLYGLAQPGGVQTYDSGGVQYTYNAFHEFHIPFSTVVSEPLVARHYGSSETRFFINPDLMLFLGLEERPAGSGVWWDPRNSLEVLRTAQLPANLEVVEIRTRYLLRYLQARQRSLLIGHYRHLHLFHPSSEQISLFVPGELTLGSAERGTKAIIQDGGFRDDLPRIDPFLQRRLHLWFQISPPAIDLKNPWLDEPAFDVHDFTLLTSEGPVAPARFRDSGVPPDRAFSGVECSFMERVYFRQEVLARYETTSGFSVDDDGSVRCQHYWALDRSTARIGNELLCTSIGDFAQSIPFEEWQHWQIYSTEPPSDEIARSLGSERVISDAVNRVVRHLEDLNSAFVTLATHLGVHAAKRLWVGSLDSLAGRQLKWVYPSSSRNDEFLKRATLLSSLVLEFRSRPLRRALVSVAPGLHQNDDTPPKPLASRNLLQRVALVAAIIEEFQPDIRAISGLVKSAEGREREPDALLQAELETLNHRNRNEFEPLAFLYDLRSYGGVAHPPNERRFAEAATSLGFDPAHLARREYLGLLDLVGTSLIRVAHRLRQASWALGAAQLRHQAERNSD